MHKRAIGAVAVTGVAALLMSACGGSTTVAAKPSSTTKAAAPAPAGTAAPVRDAAADLVIWADESRDTEITRFAFPRSTKEPYLCIADFFRPIESNDVDTVAASSGPSVVTASIIAVANGGPGSPGSWFRGGSFPRP